MAVNLKKSGTLSSLSLTPLIDVVFLLLIFFLVATRFAEEERELDITLPSASEAMPLTAKPKELFINIDKRGRFFVNNKIITAVELEDILIRAAANNPGRQSVAVRGDETSDLKYTVTALNLCKRAGIRDYRIATDN